MFSSFSLERCRHPRWRSFLVLMYDTLGKSLLAVKNKRSFGDICGNNYGRTIIYTNADAITASNVVDELQKALNVHEQNQQEIEYLDRYYKGDQPILYRRKKVRPEVNNRVVVNLAFYIVETKAAEIAGEPIQFVCRSSDEAIAERIADLNAQFDAADKADCDIDIARWRSICGTAYRYVGQRSDRRRIDGEADFTLIAEDPRFTFVCYYPDKTPAFSCQIRENSEGMAVYHVFTDGEWFTISQDAIVSSGINGNREIPVIEYPNNARRISDIEITITITDEINRMAADRANAIEQFVASWVKFVNCEIDGAAFKQMRDQGALVVKSNNGSENKADVDILSSELDQTQSQVVVADQFEKLLVIQGLADRQGNTGGDTQGAVSLRNGFYSQEKRTELTEPIFKRSERAMLRLVLNRLRVNGGIQLSLKDIDIKISRSKTDNMLVKAEVLKMLLEAGIDPERSIKTVNLFSDPEQVALESMDRMEILYPKEVDDAEKVDAV